MAPFFWFCSTPLSLMTASQLLCKLYGQTISHAYLHFVQLKWNLFTFSPPFNSTDYIYWSNLIRFKFKYLPSRFMCVCWTINEQVQWNLAQRIISTEISKEWRISYSHRSTKSNYLTLGLFSHSIHHLNVLVSFNFYWWPSRVHIPTGNSQFTILN